MPKLTRLLALLLLLFVSACSQTKPTTDSFELYILKGIWLDLKLRYDPEPAQSILLAADTNDSLFVIGLDQIESYNWDTQTITLTEDATNELIKTIDTFESQNEIQDENYKKFKEMIASVGYLNFLEFALKNHAFVIKVNGEAKYGGIFLEGMSQMAIDYPVIRVIPVDGKATLSILPVHLPFEATDPGGDAGAFWGKAEIAAQFREIIRSDEIMKIFKQVGKLEK